jgi:hypothetical protein
VRPVDLADAGGGHGLVPPLAASLDIGAGVIRYCGAVWGVEETA